MPENTTEYSVAYILEAPEKLDGTESWIQLAKTGNFRDRRYGAFSITQADFKRWVDNFKVLNGDAGLPIDVDHAPEKKGETEAAGWVKALEIRGNQLWGRVEWNALGVQLIADQRYKFISPSYNEHHRDESGRDFGTALVGAALTNRPFLNMATISLSKDIGESLFAVEESENDATLDSPRRMPLTDNIAKALGVDADADEQVVLDAISALNTEPEQKTLDALAKDEGKVVLDAGTLTQLTADAAAGRQAAKTLAEQTFENSFSKALDKGTVTPAQKDDFKTLYEGNSEATLKLLDGLAPVVNTEPQGASGASDGTAARGEFTLDNMDVDTDGLDLHERATKLAAEQGIDYLEAALQLAGER